MIEQDPIVEDIDNLKDALEEIQRLRKLNETLVKMIKHTYIETGHFFICGESGEHDGTGLPKYVHVCPSYGLAGFATYKMDREYSEPGY